MKKIIISFVGGGILGTAAGFVLGIFFYPFIFPPPVAMEQVADADNKQVIATGMFIHANVSDPVHYGRGAVTVYDDVVHLGSNFEVGPGPKFHVYLVPIPDITSASQVKGTMFVDLGQLRAFKGSQNYGVPAGVDLSNYGSVVIWCEQFGVLISPATLDFRQT